MFLEPILSQEHVLEAARRLLRELADVLARDAVGARVLRLLLFQSAIAICQSLDLGLAAPSRDPEHIAQPHRACASTGSATASMRDFGFEAAAVHVLAAEPLSERQERLGMDEAAPRPMASPGSSTACSSGWAPAPFASCHPHQSHTPERAVRAAFPSPRLPADVE